MGLSGQAWMPVDYGSDFLERSLRALSVARASRPKIWRGDRVALGCCDDSLLAVDAPSGAGRVILFDGVIDNARSLHTELGFVGPSVSDAALALSAYARWGDDFLDHLVGDFACVLWDPQRSALILGRDPLGAYPLHYTILPDGLLFASEPRGLFCHPDVPKQVDDGYLGFWLAGLPESGSQSFYRDIHRVLPGHVRIIQGGMVRDHRYWHPEIVPMLRLKRPEDYADALRATLDEAVCSMIPDHGAVGSMLSGGLDSSSVTALAARHLGKAGRRLTAFTQIPSAGFIPFDHPNRILDEGPLAASLARRFDNIHHVSLGMDRSPLLAASEPFEAAGDIPPFSLMHMPVVGPVGAEARKRGIKVMLVGSAGNRTISYDGAMLLPALLRHGRIPGLLRAILDYRDHGKSWDHVLYTALGPFLPRSLRALIDSVRGRFVARLDTVSSLAPGFGAESGFRPKADLAVRHWHYRHYEDSRETRLARLTKRDPGLSHAAHRRMYGCHTRDPTADRRVIELCLSIPEDQFQYRGERRSLIRRAMKDLLSPEILAERRRGLQAVEWPDLIMAARDALIAEIERAEASPLAARLIDLARLKRLLMQDWPKDRSDWYRTDIITSFEAQLQPGIAAARFIRRVEGGNA